MEGVLRSADAAAIAAAAALTPASPAADTLSSPTPRSSSLSRQPAYPSPEAYVTIVGGQLAKNGKHGCSVVAGGGVKIASCELSQNGEDGICVEGGGCEARVRSCTLAGNVESGVFVCSAGAAAVEGCRLSGNMHGDAAVGGRHTRARLTRCTFEYNPVTALRAHMGARVGAVGVECGREYGRVGPHQPELRTWTGRGLQRAVAACGGAAGKTGRCTYRSIRCGKTQCWCTSAGARVLSSTVICTPCIALWTMSNTTPCATVPAGGAVGLRHRAAARHRDVRHIYVIQLRGALRVARAVGDRRRQQPQRAPVRGGKQAGGGRAGVQVAAGGAGGGAHGALTAETHQALGTRVKCMCANTHSARRCSWGSWRRSSRCALIAEAR